jgi:hypothetical protein
MKDSGTAVEASAVVMCCQDHHGNQQMLSSSERTTPVIAEIDKQRFVLSSAADQKDAAIDGSGAFAVAETVSAAAKSETRRCLHIHWQLVSAALTYLMTSLPRCRPLVVVFDI